MFFFFKQKTAYEMRISDWSSDVCSSDLEHALLVARGIVERALRARGQRLEVTRVLGKHRRWDVAQESRRYQRRQLRLHVVEVAARPAHQCRIQLHAHVGHQAEDGFGLLQPRHRFAEQRLADRSEEHTSELQSLMRISYA